MNFRKKFEITLLVALVLIYGLLILNKINFVTADLGRHIKNGEMILQGGALQKVLTTNFYSYSYNNFPFLNHHWGSGVIFFSIYKLFGFSGLSVLFLIVSLLTLAVFFEIARKKGGFLNAFLAAVFLLPLLVDRTEIRPESFSYLFCGLFLWVLWKVRDLKRKRKFLVLLPILELIWVNLHVYFFLGFFLIGVFLVEEIIKIIFKKKGDFGFLKALGVTLGLAIAASLLNPAGLKGILYPLQIFDNYGYRVLENQSVFFLAKIIKYPQSLYFKVGFILLLVSWLIVVWKRKNFSLINFVLTVFISYLGFTAVRNFSLFGLLALPIISTNLSAIEKKEEKDNFLKYFLIASLSILVIIVFAFINLAYWQSRINFGFGLKEGVNSAADFFRQKNLKGPIFNNYDIGGYLIYHLYPQEKVFVDNRPEAYPSSFFDNVYIPMQESDDKWKNVDKQYNFATIFFYRLDLTPWAQTFLIKRISDPTWAPVYVDNYTIIFLKRTKANEELIKKFELPKEMFTVK